MKICYIMMFLKYLLLFSERAGEMLSKEVNFLMFTSVNGR